MPEIYQHSTTETKSHQICLW